MPPRNLTIALLALTGIAFHLALRFGLQIPAPARDWPLLAVLALGGTPLVVSLAAALWRRQFGSDLLAGLSIVTSYLLGEYLAGSIVVLMLSGGEALETYALGRASRVLEALARRLPSQAHRRREGAIEDIRLEEIHVDDELVLFPHEICPADGVVVEGHGTMDEAYLTGEPFVNPKAPGSSVMSGAINGDRSLTFRVGQLPEDSRYAKIMQVMRDSEQHRPRMRRLADRLGALYTPLAVSLAGAAWLWSGEPSRFLAVLVIATPCPLLIAIPVAIIGSISVAAQRGIIVKNPAVLEVSDECSTMIFDKTGTLTYGEPELTEVTLLGGLSRPECLGLAASLERYSRHPLAQAVVAAARSAGEEPREAQEVHEVPGEGLRGLVDEHEVRLIGRKSLPPGAASSLPPGGGLECLVLVDGALAARFGFRDRPRQDSRLFIDHLSPHHRFRKIMIVSGDRPEEVRYLADRVGIAEVHAGQSPEQKLAIVRAETLLGKAMYVGDGINDAPALMAATVGLAFGQNSDISAEAAGAVILDSSLRKVDEFMHISRNLRRIALQCAAGGMLASILGMLLAAAGLLTPVAGAVAQEAIDLAAVLNALRAAMPPRLLSDYAEPAEDRVGPAAHA